MLPNLRTVPVGGVFFAIVLFALQLAFGQEQVSRTLAVPVEAPARGPLIERGDHPEWRQFLILAATRRAGEIERLLELPDTPAHIEEPQAEERPAEAQPAALQVAALPADRDEADPADANGSVAESPSATLPLDIGETSSTELPISKAPEQPPVIRTPQQEKQPQQSRQTSGRQAQLQPAPKPALPIDLLTQLFGPFPANQQDQAVAR